jgi:hypothetical protein
MRLEFCVAAAIACASGLSQAATNRTAVSLANGINTIDVTLNSAAGTFFQEDVPFVLEAPSNVKGTLIGISGGATLLAVTAQRFSEMGNSPLISGTPTQVGNLSTFDLGQLWAPTLISFETGLYTLSLSGVKDAAVSSLRLTLDVSTIPEPSTWAMLALGLAGLAWLQRTKRTDGAKSDATQVH